MTDPDPATMRAALQRIANINSGPDQASGDWKCREAEAIARLALGLPVQEEAVRIAAQADPPMPPRERPYVDLRALESIGRRLEAEANAMPAGTPLKTYRLQELDAVVGAMLALRGRAPPQGSSVPLSAHVHIGAGGSGGSTTASPESAAPPPFPYPPPRREPPHAPWDATSKNGNNAKRTGWIFYFQGKSECPHPPGRRDLQQAFQIGWDQAKEWAQANGWQR